MNKDKTRIIIGGGASGLVCAIVSAQNYDVTIIETSARVGKKLSQTGNGRCNILNARLDGSVYSNQKLYEIISSHCPLGKTIDFLASCGIELSPPDEQGRLYPMTENASTV
ncbi:MAG: NAD(P)/FAD-dependent oxidoreductase, partial [Clostridia bacterium]